MANKYIADSMDEANAIVNYLVDRHDDYSASVSRHNLIVSWRNAELNAEDWAAIYDSYKCAYDDEDSE